MHTKQVYGASLGTRLKRVRDSKVEGVSGQSPHTAPSAPSGGYQPLRDQTAAYRSPVASALGWGMWPGSSLQALFWWPLAVRKPLEVAMTGKVNSPKGQFPRDQV